jgi:predicted nucleic acid-binding protein
LSKSVCLDTRILSRYLNGNSKAKNKIQEFVNQGYEIYTTTINLTEIIMGLRKIGEINTVRLEGLKDFFSNLETKVFDYDSALKAGELSATVLKGQMIGWKDIFIASIACLNGNIIVTSNPTHFERIPALQIIEYY